MLSGVITVKNQSKRGGNMFSWQGILPSAGQRWEQSPARPPSSTAPLEVAGADGIDGPFLVTGFVL